MSFDVNKIEKYTWKGKKNSEDRSQIEERLIDYSLVKLQERYEHCKTMLYNLDPDNPGRYKVLESIKAQRNKCNAELFFKYLTITKGISKVNYLNSLRECFDKNPEIDPKIFPIGETMTGCPDEFKDIPSELVINACLDTLGKLSKKQLTLSFILKQGIWFTAQELKEINKAIREESLRIGSKITREDFIKQSLRLPNNCKITMNPKGFTYTQFNAMINLRPIKFSELSTTQLQLLRDKVFYLLEDEVKKHIKLWKTKMEEIKEVAEYKNWEIVL